MNKLFIVTGLCFLLVSCKTGNSIFGNKSLHQQYGQKLSSAGLHNTSLGQRWFHAADNALASPHDISLPYSERGYFADENPRAVGLKFRAKRGQLLIIELQKNPEQNFTLFVELWKLNETGTPVLEEDMDTLGKKLEYEVDRDQDLLIRLQPQLLQSGEYTLAISIGPSLGFPVAGKVGRIGSFWGADRDGGARSHEGIDIFAPKGTPVVAAADGRVSSVGENNLGGKVVFMRPEGRSLNLYYAHLDEQWVKSGEPVKKGDTLGLVGNTGNARTTPPHLHFGIYSGGGAIDPIDFVNPEMKRPKELPINTIFFEDGGRTTQAITKGAIRLGESSPVSPLAVTASGYRVLTAGGKVVELATSHLTPLNRPIRNIVLKDSIAILESPELSAPVKKMASRGEAIALLGSYNEFGYIESGEIKGWALMNRLR